MEDENRVILFLDVDAFSIQVLRKDFPEFATCPSVCVLHEDIVSVSYEAKSFGITRKTKLDEAKVLCSNLHVFTQNFDSEDIDPLESSRRATWDIMNVVEEFVLNELELSKNKIQVASPDEIYVDITNAAIVRAEHEINCPQYDFEPKLLPHIYLEAQEECSTLSSFSLESKDVQTKLLVQGGFIGQKLCHLLENDPRTGFKCSAGIAQNKLLAKLACGLHRPNSVTVLTLGGTDRVSSMIKVENIPGLGKKRGKLLKEKLKVVNVRDLKAVPDEAIKELLGERLAKQVSQKVNWFDDSRVTPAELSDDIVCRRRLEVNEDCLPPTKDKIVDTIRLVSKRMEVRLVEEKVRCQRKPSKLKLGMKPGSIAELNLDADNLSWEPIFKCAMDQLRCVYDESKSPRIKEISLYAQNFSNS